MGRGTTKWWRGGGFARTSDGVGPSVSRLRRLLPPHGFATGRIDWEVWDAADFEGHRQEGTRIAARDVAARGDAVAALAGAAGWGEVSATASGGDLCRGFYAPDARMIVEVDGLAHDFRVEGDAVRDAWLRGQGFVVVRVTAADVLRDVDGVVAGLVSLIASR